MRLKKREKKKRRRVSGRPGLIVGVASQKVRQDVSLVMRVFGAQSMVEMGGVRSDMSPTNWHRTI
jgi:hypothetical protein